MPTWGCVPGPEGKLVQGQAGTSVRRPPLSFLTARRHQGHGHSDSVRHSPRLTQQSRGSFGALVRLPRRQPQS